MKRFLTPGLALALTAAPVAAQQTSAPGISRNGGDASTAAVKATSGTTARTLADWFQNVPNGIGTVAAQNTGTSGANVPFMNGANTWSAAQTLSGGGTFTGTFAGNPTWSGNHTWNGSTTFNGANTVANAHSFGFADASAANAKFIASGNTLSFSGTDASGAASTAWTLSLHTASPTWTWSVPQTLNAALSLNAVPLAVTAVPLVQSGASSTRALYTSGSASGSLSSTDGLIKFNITADTAAVSGAAFLNGVQINHNLGGGTLTGNRQALSVTIDQNSTSGNLATGNNPFYVAATMTANMHANDGGTGTLLSNAFGQAFASNPALVLYSGATYFRDAIAQEVDIATQTAAARKIGVAIVQLSNDAAQGTVADAAIKLGGQGGGTAPGWRNGLQFGGDGTSMVPVNGTMVVARMNTNWSVVGSTAVNGIDFQEYTFSGNFLRSKGFLVDGTGNAWTGRTQYAESSIDAKGSTLNGTPTINSGGTGWTTGDIATDIYNGVYTITASAGVVTAVSVFRSPIYTAASGQPATLTITGNTQSVLGPGPTAVINTSWSTSTGLALNASGGVTTFGGLTKLASYTVSGLATCNSGSKGSMGYVTDATAPTYNGALTGGGAVTIPVFCNGSAWTAH